MADQQASSSSMDDKKEQCPLQSDEVWSDLANPGGKEFKLPSVSSPLSSEGSENNDNLASPFLLLDPPTAVDEMLLEEIIDLTCGNSADSLPVLEMAPSLCHTVLSIDDEPEGVSEEKKEVDVPISDVLSSLDIDVDAFFTNQELDFGDSSNVPFSSSSQPQCPETNPTNGPLSPDGVMVGSDIFQSVQYHPQHYLAAPYVSLVGPNDINSHDHAYFFTSSNEEARVPATAVATGFPASPHTYGGLEYLSDGVFSTRSPVNIPVSTESNRVTQTCALISDLLDSEDDGQAFDLDMFQVGHGSSYASVDDAVASYLGNDMFDSYGGIVGGPASSDAKPQMTDLTTAPVNPSPITQFELGHPLGSSTKKIEESNFSDKGKGKLPTCSPKENAMEKTPRRNENVKKGRGQSNKRLKQGTSTTTAEDKACCISDRSSGDTSSPATLEKALHEAHEALENYPSQSQGVLLPKKLAFKETSNTEKPEN